MSAVHVFEKALSVADQVRRAARVVGRRIVPPEVVGAAEFVLAPKLKDAWGGPFNGQRYRQEVFSELARLFAPVAIVETGTFRGTTTDYIARTGVPVYTVEYNRRFYVYSKARFWRRRNVNLLQGDSRTNLTKLADGVLSGAKNDNVLFYLDAHWGADLPLARELDIVFGGWPRAVVMIDDFQVPHDSGYTYDDYGQGKALTPDYIAPAVAKHDLVIYYPATPAAEETGKRRGSVILAKRDPHGSALASMSLLRT